MLGDIAPPPDALGGAITPEFAGSLPDWGQPLANSIDPAKSKTDIVKLYLGIWSPFITSYIYIVRSRLFI